MVPPGVGHKQTDAACGGENHQGEKAAAPRRLPISNRLGQPGVVVKATASRAFGVAALLPKETRVYIYRHDPAAP